MLESELAHIMNLCKCGCGQKTIIYHNIVRMYVHGHNRRNKKCSEETKLKMSKSAMNKAGTFGFKDKKHTEKSKNKIREKRKGFIITDKQKEKQSISMKHKWSDENFRNSQSQKTKLLWENPEYAWKVMHKRDISGPEMKFINIAKEYNLDYLFIGNSGYKIGRKYPDFIDEKNKRIIEIFGEFFHKKEEEKERINYFKEIGYNCLVIWASELKYKDKVIEKVKIFEKGGD